MTTLYMKTKKQSMKKIFFALTALFLLGTVVGNAQGEKSLKAASKSLSKFTSDFGNTAALEEAKNLVQEAFQDEKVASSAKSWNTRGEIFYNVADAQYKQELLNPAFVATDLTAGIEAVAAYAKAFDLSEKKGDRKKAIEGLKNAEAILNNVGISLYNKELYNDAYKNFEAEITAAKKLREIGEESRLDEGTLFAEKLFFAGITGFYGEQYEASLNLLEEAESVGYSDNAMYQLLYESYAKLGKSEEGLKYLQKGRELFPDDAGLLFSEINYYLSKGELDAMIEKLKIALDKEPTNVSVMLTLGQVYDQLHVKANEAGNKEEADAKFEEALGYYTQAAETDTENFDINYSLGALYYNKAASFTPALNEAAEDFSVEGNKRYDKIQAEMAGYFDRALPYFLKADELNGKDRNTLIALKEIYVRKNMFDKSNEYKDRLDSLEE